MDSTLYGTRTNEQFIPMRVSFILLKTRAICKKFLIYNRLDAKSDFLTPICCGRLVAGKDDEKEHNRNSHRGPR